MLIKCICTGWKVYPKKNIFALSLLLLIGALGSSLGQCPLLQPVGFFCPRVYLQA